MPDTGNKDGYPCPQRTCIQVSKKIRTVSWRYTCGALCLTGGHGEELGEMRVQEKHTKGSEIWAES